MLLILHYSCGLSKRTTCQCHYTAGVPLPGLHRREGQDRFRQEELEDWVTEKIADSGVIILNAVTAEDAVAGGKETPSVAESLAYNADKHCERTISIITKADTALNIPEVLQEAIVKSKTHGCHTGCVLVSTVCLKWAVILLTDNSTCLP